MSYSREAVRTSTKVHDSEDEIMQLDGVVQTLLGLCWEQGSCCWWCLVQRKISFHMAKNYNYNSIHNFAQSSMHRDIRVFSSELLLVPLASLLGVCLLEVELQDSGPNITEALLAPSSQWSQFLWIVTLLSQASTGTLQFGITCKHERHAPCHLRR